MEEIASKNASSLKLPQMSERQAILYFGKGGNNPLNSNNAEIANQVVEYHKYWLHKKKMNENAHPKEVLARSLGTQCHHIRIVIDEVCNSSPVGLKFEYCTFLTNTGLQGTF